MRKWSIVLIAVVLMFGLTQTSQADDIADLRVEMQRLRQDYETRIHQLQSQVNQLSRKQADTIEQIAKKQEKFGVDYVGRYDGPNEKGGLIIRDHSGHGQVSIGGYADMEFGSFDNDTAVFRQHRWILNIGAQLGERLTFYSEYEIEYGGPNSANGDGEAQVEQAWMDYLMTDWVNLRMGALLVPFGRFNIYHDSDLRDLTDRPLVARDVTPSTWTESGAGIWGEINPTIGSYEDLTIGYEAYAINGLDDGFSDIGMSGAKGSFKQDNNDSKSFVGRLDISPAMGQEFGLSTYVGKYDDKGDNYIRGYGVDWFSSWNLPDDFAGLGLGPLEFVGEYARFNIDEPAHAVGSVTDVPKFMKGAFAQMNIHFWPEFLSDTMLGRTFEDPTLTFVTRYGWAKIDDDSDSNTGDNKETRWTIGLNYRPVESWVAKFEYQINDTKNEKLERGKNNGFLVSVAMGF